MPRLQEDKCIPELILGNNELLRPIKTYPKDANIAIGIPQAAEVPILDVRLIPRTLKVGTEKIPPPIPKTDDRKPINEPATYDLFPLFVFF